MDPPSPPTLADSIAAAQGWWREAGVDFVYHDEPTTWLAPQPAGDVAIAAPAAEPAPERPRIGGNPSLWPSDLGAYARWWLEAPGLGPVAGRIPPRGPANAPLMVVVPMPEAEDADTLLAGPQGRLLGNMARAMGFAPDAVYFAPALARHVPLPDWPALAADGLGDVLRHHVALANPARLIVLGGDILPLLGHDPAQAAPAVSELAIQQRQLPLMSSYAPGRLLDHPRLRAELWRRWLDWTGTGTG